MRNLPNFESKWIKQVKQILNDTGRTVNGGNQENTINHNLKYTIKQTLIDQNQQYWFLQLQHSDKGET